MGWGAKTMETDTGPRTRDNPWPITNQSRHPQAPTYACHLRLPFSSPHSCHPPPEQHPKKICDVVGVVEHGFFLDMTDAVIVAGKTGIEVINKK